MHNPGKNTAGSHAYDYTKVMVLLYKLTTGAKRDYGASAMTAANANQLLISSPQFMNIINLTFEMICPHPGVTMLTLDVFYYHVIESFIGAHHH